MGKFYEVDALTELSLTLLSERYWSHWSNSTGSTGLSLSPNLSADGLQRAGFEVKELLNYFEPRRLAEMGFSVDNFLENGCSAVIVGLAFAKEELEIYGYTCAVLAQRGFQWRELKSLGFGAIELKRCGASPRTLESLFGRFAFLEALYTSKELIEDDCDAKFLQGAAIMVSDLVNNGYTRANLLELGYKQRVVDRLLLLRDAGYSRRVVDRFTLSNH